MNFKLAKTSEVYACLHFIIHRGNLFVLDMFKNHEYSTLVSLSISNSSSLNHRSSWKQDIPSVLAIKAFYSYHISQSVLLSLPDCSVVCNHNSIPLFLCHLFFMSLTFMSGSRKYLGACSF